MTNTRQIVEYATQHSFAITTGSVTSVSHAPVQGFVSTVDVGKHARTVKVLPFVGMDSVRLSAGIVVVAATVCTLERKVIVGYVSHALTGTLSEGVSSAMDAFTTRSSGTARCVRDRPTVAMVSTSSTVIFVVWVGLSVYTM